MKVRFYCSENFKYNDRTFLELPCTVAEFDVAEMPTEEQCKAIYNEIHEAIAKWDKDNDRVDFDEFDYWSVCFQVAKKYLKILPEPIVKTVYL